MSEFADYKNLWVYIETADGDAKSVGLELLNPGRRLAAYNNEKVIAVVVGKNAKEIAKKAIAYGADEAITVDRPEYEYYNTDGYKRYV